MPLRKRRGVWRLLNIALLCAFASAMPRLAGAWQTPNPVALVGGTIYSSPTAAAIANGTVMIRKGKITAVGDRKKIRIPSGARVVNCEGMFVVAGFQNSHVHFTEAKWERAVSKPATELSRQFKEMLLRYGFTTVVDTGSFLENTLALRKRVERGEVRGPRILTAGTPIYPPKRNSVLPAGRFTAGHSCPAQHA